MTGIICGLTTAGFSPDPYVQPTSMRLYLTLLRTIAKLFSSFLQEIFLQENLLHYFTYTHMLQNFQQKASVQFGKNQ